MSTDQELAPSLTAQSYRPQRSARRTRRPPVIGWLRPYQWFNLFLVVLYLAVAIAGITTSNLGSIWNRQSSIGPYPDTIGRTQDMRSDEFWVGTPLALWTLLVPGEARVAEMSALSGWTMRIPTGPAQTVAFWDQAVISLGRVIPEETAFALQWWLPSLLVLLFLPTLFAQFGAKRRFGYAAALIIMLSPAEIWWSMQPSTILGPSIAGCVAMIAAYDRLKRRQWPLASFQALAGGVLLANVTSRYPVWVLILMGSVLAAALARIVAERGHWPAKLLAIGITGVIALGLTALALWESMEGLRVFAGTVYPGSRRVAAHPVGLAAVFGAPFLHAMAGQPVSGTNASELSTSFNILLVALVLLLPSQTRFWREWRSHVPELALTFFGLLWLAWGTFSFGWLGSKIPLLNMVPSYRAIQAVGFIGVILFFLVIAKLDRVRHSVVIMVSAMAAALTGYAGSLLQASELPKLSTYLVWGASFGVGLALYALLRWPGRWWSLGLAVGMAAVGAFGTFPIQVGLGDYRNSPVAEHLLVEGTAARASGSVWATDQMSFDALLVATGIPSLSGLQRPGPDASQWAKLDPTGEHKDSWNRGAGYVKFRWQNGAELSIGDNGFDVVQVTADPCELKKLFPNLTHVVSEVRLTGSCLRPANRLTWARERLTIYEVGG